VGDRTLVMGVVNVTPDSFSDGGRFLDAAAAEAHARQLVAEGADLLDIGGESTRPGAEAVDAKEELRRVLPVLDALADVRVPRSIDTRKPEVARAALRAGASVVNDVAALRAPGMAELCAAARCGVVLMHMQGEPATMQRDPRYGDVGTEVAAFLRERAVVAERAGVAREAIVLDPGLGFGKTTAHNLALLRELPKLASLGYPLLVGHSRKRFLAELAANDTPDARLHAGLAVATFAALQGAHIVRTHDVAATVAAVRAADALRGRA
jgi:dihydropteroate synthase